MSEMKRKCKICEMPLSVYNIADICFCHKGHPGNLRQEDRFLPIGAGHDTSMLDITIRNEYGPYGLLNNGYITNFTNLIKK